MISVLYVPDNCILHQTEVGRMVREKRSIFLHKGCFVKFRSYAEQQLSKMKEKKLKQLIELEEKCGLDRHYEVAEVVEEQEARSKDEHSQFEYLHRMTDGQLQEYAKLRRACGKKIGKRAELIKKYGWDVKFGSHTVRLLLECEQLLTTGDLNLQRDREILKPIKNGEWTIEQVEKFFREKSSLMEELFVKCKLPDVPRKKEIKQLLFDCMESHWGSLEGVVSKKSQAEDAIKELSPWFQKHKNLMLS